MTKTVVRSRCGVGIDNHSHIHRALWEIPETHISLLAQNPSVPVHGKLSQLSLNEGTIRKKILFLYIKLMKIGTNNVGGTAFYQHEPLTVRLKNLLHDYPEGIGIVKELIQNADDAGASRVQIILDWRTHPFERLPDERMVQLMGPAMLVYNDSVFSDADFENIQRLGMGGKRENLWKTGRFGVGFNSVYHVTDYPSFISRDRIVFFDPHAWAIPGTSSGEPGRSWLFAQERWWDYPDFMRVYEPGGLEFGVENFNGTLFRLPLRTEAHARKSEIRSQPFTKANFQELLQELMQSGEEMLLFLKSVVELQVCEIQSDGSKRNLLAISTKNRQKVQAQRKKLLSPLQGSPETLLTLCRTRPTTLPSVSYLHTIETTNKRVVQLRLGELLVLFEWMKKENCSKF